VWWAWRAGHRALRLRRGRPIAAPLFATLAVTWRCNHRCFFCDLPGRTTPMPDTEELRERVRWLAAAGVLAVGITGGEPLLHPGIFAVLAEARRRGLLVHLNSNGSRWTPEVVAGLAAGDLHSVNLSLDGAGPGTHDHLRGAPGAFAELEQGVRALLGRRRRPRVSLVMAVSHRNRHEVGAFVARGREWGVDAVGFLPHHALADAPADFTVEEVAELAAALGAVGGAAENSDPYREGIAPFLGGAATPVACSAPRTHVALDPAGNAYPCVPLMTLGRAGMDREEWRRRGFTPLGPREQETCRRCWWNCHRELDLGLGLLTRGPDTVSGSSPPARCSPISSASGTASPTTTTASSSTTPASTPGSGPASS